MKKLIAISVMCALVVGAAFAEVTVGGKIHLGGQILNGESVTDSSLGTLAVDSDWYNTAIAVNFGNATAGGKLSIHNFNPSFYDYFVWWRPIQQLRIQMGVNADGNWGTAEITGWGFTGEAKNRLGAINEYSGPVFGLAHARSGFYGGTGETKNISLSLFLIDGLTINLWVPITGDGAGFTFSRFEANIVYNIEEVGKVTLSYKSNTGYLEGDPVKGGSRVKDVEYTEKLEADEYYYETPSWWVTEQTGTPIAYLSFYLTAIENMAIDLGIAYQFPLEYSYDKYTKADADGDIWRYTYSYKQNFPIDIGLGYRISLGDFTFKLRTAFSIGASKEVTDESVKLKDVVSDTATVTGVGTGTVEYPTLSTQETKISVNINPSYKLGSKLTAYLFAGIGIQATDDWEKVEEGIFYNNGDNTVVSWFVNPYVEIPAGDLRFQIGFQLYSDGLLYPYYKNGVREFDPAKISWAIPIGFRCYF